MCGVRMCLCRYTSIPRYGCVPTQNERVPTQTHTVTQRECVSVRVYVFVCAGTHSDQRQQQPFESNV